MRTVLMASMRHHTRRYVAASVAVVIGVAFIVVIGMLTGATRSGLTADAGAPVSGVDLVVSPDAPRDAQRLVDAAAEGGFPALTLGYAMEPVSRDGVQESAGIFNVPAPRRYCVRWDAGQQGALVDFRIRVSRPKKQ